MCSLTEKLETPAFILIGFAETANSAAIAGAEFSQAGDINQPVFPGILPNGKNSFDEVIQSVRVCGPRSIFSAGNNNRLQVLGSHNTAETAGARGPFIGQERSEDN